MSLRNIFAAFIIAVLPVVSVFAAPITLTTAQSEFTAGTLNQGWWSSPSFQNPTTNDNYYTGTFQQYSLHSFFTFDRSNIAGNITNATLRVMRGSQANAANLSLWDVTTDVSVVNHKGSNMAIYTDLGSGISYGDFSVATGNVSDFLSFALNSQGLAALNSATKYFTIGGSVASSQAMFGGTDGNVTYLDLNFSPIPEPASLLLMALGFLGIVSSQRKRRFT